MDAPPLFYGMNLRAPGHHLPWVCHEPQRRLRAYRDCLFLVKGGLNCLVFTDRLSTES